MRMWLSAGVIAASMFVAAPASAQVVQSIQFGGGGFFPRGLDARHENDVLVRDFVGEPIPGLPSLTDAFAFEIKDFRGGSVFGEWNAAFGDRIEFGASVGYYARSVPTVYLDLVDEDFNEIEQTLRLRVVPLSAVVRFLPLGSASSVQPYVGAGISALRYRYSEIGAFVDPNTLDVYDDERYVAVGTAPGALLLGGLRIPVGGDVFGFQVEGRYQFGAGDTGGIDEGFLADKIDLSGMRLNFSLLVRF